MRKAILVGVVATSVVALDQATKLYIRDTIPLYHSFPVIDSFFHITHVANPGGAFNLLSNADESVRLPFFFLASALALGALVYFMRQIPARQTGLLVALAGVLGGAIGNLIDRIYFGAVTDFLDVFWRDYHWPAFNVADSFISVGVVVLFLHSLRASHDDPAAS
jgi:signal peptidase II